MRQKSPDALIAERCTQAFAGCCTIPVRVSRCLHGGSRGSSKGPAT
jgi:hypothetical protein